MTKKTGVIMMLIGTALILAALSLVVYNKYEENKAELSAQRALYDIIEKVGDDAHISALPLPDELEAVNIDGYDYIGYIEIPSLELRLPVMADWSYTKLKIAPCHYYGNLKSGMVIAAHNYEQHFGKIRDLRQGDAVYFIDMSGRAYEYKTAEVEVLEPTAIEEMVSDGWDLTLFTCTYGGQSRVTVRCVIDD